MSSLKKLIKNTILFKIIKKIVFWMRYVFSPLGFIRNYIFFPIGGFVRTSAFGKKFGKYKYIEEYKNSYWGKRCFILATGPSLKVEDVNKLKNEMTIAVNSFYRIYSKTVFRPNYYVVLDPDVQEGLLKKCSYSVKEMAKKTVFFNSIRKAKEKGISYLPMCYQNHWFNIFNPKYDYAANLKFSDDLLYGLYDKYTVTASAIELAIYMGFKEIYLLGVDCNYSGPTIYFEKSDKNDFKPNELQAALTQKAMMAGYKFLEKESSKRDVKIYNATRGGMLEEFERVNFDEIIK